MPRYSFYEPTTSLDDVVAEREVAKEKFSAHNCAVEDFYLVNAKQLTTDATIEGPANEGKACNIVRTLTEETSQDSWLSKSFDNNTMPSLALITTLDGSTAPIVHAPAQRLPQKLPEQKQGIKATETHPVSTAAPKNPFASDSAFPQANASKKDDINSTDKSSNNAAFPLMSTAAPKDPFSTKPASERAFPPLPAAKNYAKALDIATRLWSPRGHQSSQFRAAVCTCLSLGLSRADIACHIRQTACTTPILEKNKTDDFFYRRIYNTVYHIDTQTKNCVSKEENKSGTTNRSIYGTVYRIDTLVVVEEEEEGVAKKCVTKEENRSGTTNDKNAVASSTAKSVSISRLAENFMGHDLEKERQEEAANGIEEKALEMLQVILDISHRQSGALSPDLGTSVSEPAAASKHRVKMMIEQPDQAKAFIRMVLRDDPDTDSLKLLNMMDFYSIWE